MKWADIKRAAERAGVSDDDDIIAIECELRDGDNTLQRVHQGTYIRLIENVSLAHLKEERSSD